MTKPAKYDPKVRAADTVRAQETVIPRLYPEDAMPLAVDFSGNCPRCGDRLSPERRWLVAVSPAARLDEKQRQKIIAELRILDIDLSSGDETFDLTCGCEEDHPKHPANKRGCGATYRVRVAWSK